MLSNECEPEMVIWLFGPASVTPGARSVIELIERVIGSSLIVSILKFVDTCVLSAAGDAAAVTVTASETEETLSSTSARLVLAALAVTCLRTVCIPESSKTAGEAPGGGEGKVQPPASPLTAVRTPCSAGEVIVTVAPGSALPSLVTVPRMLPVVVPWARREDAARRSKTTGST